MSSKVTRQLVFKMKLEGELRRKQNKYVREEMDIATESDLENAKFTIKDDEKRKEANEEKKNLLKKREEYIARAAKFSERKKKRLEEKKRKEEQSTILQDKNIWSELECIIKDNQMVLKGLENYKVIVEIKEKEEKIKQIQSKTSKKYKDSWFVPICELQYNKDTKLGQGKFGSVYSGTFRENIPVAVKILRNKHGRKVALVSDFLKEKKVMVKLKHPNLVQLYAVTRDEQGNDILIQELMENGSLSEYLQQISTKADVEDCEETSFKSALSWSVQVARGMAHLESLNIVHRDLAARNILLDENKRAKVADFGMAVTGQKRHGDCDYLPVRWTAPEAIFDKQFSSASDVWSFGITMWEIFTLGEKPFKYLGIKEYKEKIRNDYQLKKNDFRCEQSIQISKATEKELKDVFSVMTKCWNINPAERPKFSTLEEDLHHFHLTGDLIGYTQN